MRSHGAKLPGVPAFLIGRYGCQAWQRQLRGENLWRCCHERIATLSLRILSGQSFVQAAMPVV